MASEMMELGVAKALVKYWFSDRVRPAWFNSTPEMDLDIKKTYESLWVKAKRGELVSWLEEAESALALIVLLDQLPLNMYRGLPESFAGEQLAVSAAKTALNKGYGSTLTIDQCLFLYMPLMHSEKLDDQDLSVTLYEALGRDGNIRFAKHHQGLIKTFGRFPHRNAILNRKSTEAELKYLASKSAFTG